MAEYDCAVSEGCVTIPHAVVGPLQHFPMRSTYKVLGLLAVFAALAAPCTAIARSYEVVSETAPLVTVKPLEATSADERLYLKGEFAARAANGEHVLGFVLDVEILTPGNTVIGRAVIDGGTTGLSFDTMIVRLLPFPGGMGAHEIGRIAVRLRSFETVESRAREERERAKREAEEKAAAARRETERRRARAEAEAARATAIRAKKWPTNIENAVIARKIMIGMTDEQVRMAWGEPTRVTETITASGTSEEWSYGSGQHLLFANHVLTVIQRTAEHRNRD